VNEWVDLAKQALEPGDDIQHSYMASYNGQSGFLVLSKSKLVFVREKGLFRIHYDVTLEVPYVRIDEIQRHKTQLILVEGEERHTIVSSYTAPIKSTLEELKASILTVPVS
jgi:hypothetical protein